MYYIIWTWDDGLQLRCCPSLTFRTANRRLQKKQINSPEKFHIEKVRFFKWSGEPYQGGAN